MQPIYRHWQLTEQRNALLLLIAEHSGNDPLH